MTIKPLETNFAALQSAQETIAPGQAKGTTDGLKIAESARQFEAMLVRQVLSETMKPTSATGGAAAPGADIYQSFVTDIVADDISKGSALGVANMLQSQIQSGSTKTHTVLPGNVQPK